MLNKLDKHLPKLVLLTPKATHNEKTRSSQPSKVKKVLILSQFYPPDYAATGQLLAELAAHLSKLGMKIGVFTGQPGYAFDQDNAPKHEIAQRVFIKRSRTSRLWPMRIRGRAINGLLFCVRSAMHLFKVSQRYQLLLITSEPPYLSILGYLAYRFFKLPYTCLLYDLYPDVAVALKVLSPQNPIIRLWDRVNRHIWQNAQQIIVLSSSMKERVVAKCPSIAEKIAVIPSWSNPKQIYPIPKANNWFAQKYHLTDYFTVQYSGNLGRCHDLDTILKSAELLRDQPIRFLFIGRGAQLEACIERVKRLNLTHCHFLPYQDKEILTYSLTACDLSLVSISPGLEGLVAPSKLYGILAAGRPVAAVCEPHSYLHDLLAQAQCGQAFNNGDAEGLAQYIIELAKNPEQVQFLGNSGREYLQHHFTPEIVAREYFQVLNQD